MKTYKLSNKTRFFNEGLIDLTGYSCKVVSNKTRLATARLHQFIWNKIQVSRCVPENICDL